jgi:hypothetical protein
LKEEQLGCTPTVVFIHARLVNEACTLLPWD